MNIGTLLATTAHAWQMKMDARLRGDARMQLGRLSLSKWKVLLQLQSSPKGLSQRQLADLLSVEGATMVNLIDALETASLVERHTCPDDRRLRIIRLQPLGRHMGNIIQEHAEAVWEEIVQSLPTGQAEQCQSSLHLIRNTLTHPYPR